MEMVLQGEWRILYEELLNWHAYCTEHDKHQGPKSSQEHLNKVSIRNYANEGQLSRALAAADKGNEAQDATAEAVMAMHGPGDSMTPEDWASLQRQVDEDDSARWPEEPTQAMAHDIYNIIRGLDQHSAGSISGLLNSDLTPLVRQVNAVEWAGKPGLSKFALEGYPKIYGLVRLVYKIATNQINTGGHCGKSLRATKPTARHSPDVRGDSRTYAYNTDGLQAKIYG